ncbi:MAG: GDP-mannose 4,6-dehydratase [bacterium]|nr:MAG: GDP-mannose 4,6-dehydratase [bacterium]
MAGEASRGQGVPGAQRKYRRLSQATAGFRGWCRGGNTVTGKVIVTGAAGFIGSHLCEHLLDKGYRVIGIDSLTDYYSPERKRGHIKQAIGHKGFTLVEEDLNDCDIETLLDETECVFHLAAQAGVRGSWGSEFNHYVSSNIVATQRLLEVLKGHGSIPLVFASSSSVYGDTREIPMREGQSLKPVSPYGATKLSAEHLCELYHINFGLRYVALRYFTVFGPRQRPDMAFSRFITASLGDEPVEVYGEGTQTRDFTYVSDAVAATAQAMLYDGPQRVFNIGGGNRSSILDVLSTIERLIGKKLEIRFDAPAKGDVLDTWADTGRARAELGFEPTVSLETGLEAEIDWYRSHLRVMEGG